jgi:replicative DNA helicase
VSAEEKALTAEDQAAFDRVIAMFPAARVGHPEPHTPESQRHYEEILAEQTRATGGPTILETDSRMVDGLAFVLDALGDTPAVWGREDDVLWSAGEPLLIVGPDGVGKTTLAHSLVLGLLELRPTILGFPVAPADRGVLYVQADRPKQGARAFWRMVREEGPSTHGRLKEALLVWRGPPPFNLSREPERLAQWAEAVGASVIVLDSLGFVVPDMSKDETGSGVAAAFAHCAARGIELLALTHGRKAQADNRRPRELSDVYGSRWITSACGSVLSLWGNAGDPVLELRHLKQPNSEVGPLMVELDRERGEFSVVSGSDLLGALRAAGNGLTAQEAGRLMDAATPKAAEVKARRRLDAYVRKGLAHKREGATFRGSLKEPDRYYIVSPSGHQGSLR